MPPPSPPRRSGAPLLRPRWREAIRPPWLGRNMAIVLAARLAMSGARAIAGVVTSLYLAAEGFSGVEIGALFVVVTVASALMSSGIGLVSDRVGRKPFLIAVPLVDAGAAVVFSEVRAPFALFLCAGLGSFGRGAGAGGGSVGPYQPAEAAFVTEAVPARARTAALGRLAFASTLGALCGGLLAGLAGSRAHLGPVAATSAYRPAFLAAAALAAVAGLLALWLEEERRGGAGKGRGTRSRLRWPRRSWAALWRLWVTNGVNGVALGLIGPFVSYWLYRRYGVGPSAIGILFAVVNVGSLASTLTAAGIARRIGTVRAIIAVRATTGLLLIPMVLAPAFWIAGAVYFVRMIVQRVGMPLRQSFTQDLADPSERASVAALSNLPAQGTMAGSQVVAGYLFDEVALAAPFELAAVFQCANAVLYGVLFERRSRGARAGPPTATAAGVGDGADETAAGVGDGADETAAGVGDGAAYREPIDDRRPPP